ncbi:unnamed protein product, partial [Musa acuminata subsp. burmannicoides]
DHCWFTAPCAYCINIWWFRCCLVCLAASCEHHCTAKRQLTMLVELELTATLFCKMGHAITPTQCCPIALMVPIASTRGMARLKQLVTYSATAKLTSTDPSANGCLSCNSQAPIFSV